MYTATIVKKEILEQHQYILLTVELKSPIPVVEETAPKFILDDDGNPKLDKKGKPKQKNKKKKDKFPTKVIHFKFKIDVPWSEMKKEIKARIEQIEKCESEEIPIGEPLNLETP